MSVTVALRALPRVLERHQERVQTALVLGLQSAARFGEGHLRKVTPKDRGMAQASWSYRKGPKNARPPTPVAWIENSSPYIGILEKGARPHPVSLEGQRAIYEWVERHFRLAGGIVLSGRDMGAGIKSDRLTNTKSRAHKVARMDYLDKLSKLGSMLEDKLVRNFPDMGKRMVPAALNIAAAIIQKIRTQGQKPGYFVRDSLPFLGEVAQREVERLFAEISRREGGK